MFLKNKTQRAINLDFDTIMPNDVWEVRDSWKKSPHIKELIKAGEFEVVDGPESLTYPSDPELFKKKRNYIYF